MTTASERSLPLARRPRRPRPEKPPTQHAAARALRRTAVPTTAVTWTRGGLPSYPKATAGVPLGESLISVLVVVLLFVPPAIATGFSPLCLVSAVVSLVVLSMVLWARRVVVGADFVAVRQLGRYHVANADHVRHIELRPSAHGGVLCLHTDDGRSMRLRRVEVAQPEINEALRTMATLGGGTRDTHVEELLKLTHDQQRIRHRYLADAVQ